MKLSTQLLIDGQFVTGDGQAEPILNPATGSFSPRCQKPRSSR
jgi:hypothetical protein